LAKLSLRTRRFSQQCHPQAIACKIIGDSGKRIKNFIGFSQEFMDENKSKNQALLQVGLFTL
jgi:hypothetical protein